MKYGRWVCAAVLFLSACWLVVYKLNDFDIWWHLRTGQWILQHRSIPDTDPYSYTIAGHPWVTFEWLSQILFYAAYQAGGAAGLIGFKTLVVLAMLACMAATARPSREAAFAAALPLLALAVAGGRNALAERPQIFTFLLSAAYLLILRRSDERPRLLWLLPALQAAWANLHGGASIIGLVLTGAWAAGAAVDRSPQFRRLTQVAAACAAASLLNPHGWGIFTHAFGTVGFKGREVIQEWRPLTWDLQWWPLWATLLPLELVTALAWWKQPRRRTADALLWLAFIPFSLRAVRFSAQAAFVFGQLAAANVADALAEWKPAPRRLAALLLGSCLAMAAVSWTFDAYAFPATTARGVGVNYDVAPAARFIRQAGIKGPMFNSYELGGALIWHLPELPVFVDGRNLEYGSEFVDRAMHWFQPALWPGLQHGYRFQVAVVGNGAAYVCGVLDRDPEWALVYWDDAALVYVRRDGPNAEAARRWGYTLLSPNSIGFDWVLPLVEDQDLSMRLLSELNRSVDAAPEDLNPRVLRSFVLRRIGRLESALEDSEAAARSKLNEGRAEALYESAVTLAALGRNAEAAARYKEVLRRAARLSDTGMQSRALNNMAVLEYRKGDLKAAHRLWRRALALDPANEGIRRNLQSTGGGN